ncbi:granulocyte colony-stimulating factor receptor-like isoform X4 [Erythrolamprus reginae]
MPLTLAWIVGLLTCLACLGVMPRTLEVKYCVSFWGKNITCYWDLLPEMDFPTTYTLQVTEEAGRCQRDFGLPKNCVADPGEHWCGVPVENLFAFYKIKLIAQNQKLQADSLEKCLHGMSIVKLSAPVLNVVLPQSRCLQPQWNQPGDELISATEAQYEIRYCDLVELPCLQPLKPKEANGEILEYSLRSQRKGELPVPECITHHLQCRLLLPASEEFLFYLTAKNTVGISPPSRLMIPAFHNPEVPPSPLSILVSSAGDHSLLLQWPLPSNPKMDFVLEWTKVAEKEGGDPHWQHQPENASQAVITEAIEPGHLYAVKVFGLLDGRLGAFGSAEAYSKQIAPLRAPALYPTQVWKSWVELQWERLPLEERGGEIQNYTLYYKEEKKDDYRDVVLDSSVHRYVIKGLTPGSTMRVYMVTANEGGSTRGSVLSIRTKNYDYGEAEILISVFCIGFIVLLAATLVCVSRHRSLQKYLWPQIPDPRKSNLATWIPQNMCLDFTTQGNEKWSQAYLGVTVSDLIQVFPSQPENADPGLFLGKPLWPVESPKALQKVIPMAKTRTLSQEPEDQHLHKSLAAWNEVEYSQVLVIKSGQGPGQTWSASPCIWSSCWDLAKTRPGSPFNQQFWVQNLTYETLSDVKSYKRATIGSLGEFPLLVSLVTLEGELCGSREKSHP